MLHCVVAFPCFCTFYASPTSLVVFVDFLFFLVSALFMESKPRYDTVPRPQDSNQVYGPHVFILEQNRNGS